MVPINGFATAAVALLGRSSRLAIRTALVVWVVAAAAWWAADLPMGWGPEPGPGLLVYSLLGAGMIQARFMMTARSGGPSL